jgi:cephalosporin-C deacetylase-like acetyl esterase
MYRRLLIALALVASLPQLNAAEPIDTSRGDQMLKEYFAAETAKLAGACLTDIKSREDWDARRDESRQQLFEMLGLSPLPEKTPLKVTITGRFEQPAYSVENLHYQSRPGLYVTGNLYIPKGLDKPAPAILYVCGHAKVKKGETSYGGKTHYHFHADWFARHGYVCLVIDTLQLGEIEGIHHGTYNHGMWWWNARGYTSAGVEAWNCIRALDLLQSRKEVDGERLGVTGRSGGGAYSWWIAALDERIKAAVPVAGITDLTNHVVDGVVEGHCDCMFMVNTYRWDYAQVAALVAPRALLLTNTDKDGIFPLDGVTRLHAKVAKIYKLYKVPNQLGLQISEGGHNDIQELQLAAFRWFNRHLKNDDPLIESAAKKVLQPEQLQVFKELPIDQQNTRIHETFVPQAPSLPAPQSTGEFAAQRDSWRQALDQKVFRGWPSTACSLNVTRQFSVDKDGMRLTAYDFTSQENVRLRLYDLRRVAEGKDDLAVLNVLDDAGWSKWLASMRVGFADVLASETLPAADEQGYEQLKQMFGRFHWTMAYIAPRGVGPTAFDQSARKQTQHRRRFNLLGQTLEGMQVYDVRRAIQALRTLPEMQGEPLWLQGEREAAGLALYASLYEPSIVRLDLWHLPRSHRDGPSFLNVLRFLDVPQAVAMAGEHSQIRMYQRDTAGWEYPTEVAKQLKWNDKQIVIRPVKAE